MSSVGVGKEELVEFVNVFDGSEECGYSLVWFGYIHVKDAPGAGGAGASCLFHDHGHGVALVEDSEFAAGVSAGGGVSVDAPVDQDVVNVGHEGPDVACVRTDSLGIRPVLEGIQKPLDGLVVIVEIGFVETVNRTGRRNSNVGMSVQKDTLIRVQREPINTRTQRYNQNSGGSVFGRVATIV